MKMYYAGGEVPSHRKILTEIGAAHVAMSFIGLSRRVKFSKPWTIASHFPDDVEIFLDSGAHSVNSAEERYSLDDLRALDEKYRDFVAGNIDRVALVSEFDALPLGPQAIELNRQEFYDSLPREKFLPIWHPELGGVEYLQAMAEEYKNIGITATALSGRNLAPTLNSLTAQGINLHAVGLTSVDEMYAIRWHSVSSTSWISPQQYGDTIIWTGKVLKRYPKRQKEQARKRYRTLFESNGFDSSLIEADDHTELLRLSAWSWSQLMDDIDKKQHNDNVVHLRTVTNLPEEDEDGLAEVDGEVVVNPPQEERQSITTVKQRETVTIPIIGIDTSTRALVHEDGTTEEITSSSLTLRSESTRVCSSCFLANKCPAFDPEANCAYNIPVEIKTRDQFIQMQNSLIEMQAQRVLFMRFAEEQEGGYADPNLSSEMDRLQKMLKTKHDMEETFSVKFEAKGSGDGGMGLIGRLFGEQASERVQALPEPVKADSIIEAEIIKEFEDR